jgi:hypothetical protein
MIKDSHTSAVIAIKFCDWAIKERPHSEDKQAWMFVSCDTEGKVILSRIQSYFKILTVEKITVADQSKLPLQIKSKKLYQTIATRFINIEYGLNQSDSVVMAVASCDILMINLFDKQNRL